MVERTALLIGVPECDEFIHLNLPVVHRDVADIRKALQGSGYKVTIKGADIPSEATRNKIPQFIRDACNAASRGSVLILYFSGHGINFQGKDLFIPWDADLRSDDLADKCVHADIRTLVSGSKANTIVFFADACREAVILQQKAVGVKRLKQAGTFSGRQFVTVFACSENQFSQYVLGGKNQEEGFSLFTRAISKVLAPTHPARTLGEVIKAAQDELNTLAVKYGKQQQQITLRCEQTLESEWRSRVICDGNLVAEKQGSFGGVWGEQVRLSRLWLGLYSDQEGRPREGADDAECFASAAANVAAEAQRIAADAAKAVPQDVWRDDEYAERVLGHLEQLVSDVELLPNAAELAVLLAAPFEREAIYARAIRQTATCNPLNVTPEQVDHPTEIARAASDIWPKLWLVHRQRPRLMRAIWRLLGSEPSRGEFAQAIAAWMMHRFVSGEPSFWRLHREEGRALSNAAPGSDNPALPVVAKVMSPERLLLLAKCVGADPAAIDRPDEAILAQAVAVASSSPRVEVREQLLAYLLAVAGWMAIDVRDLPELVVEHIASPDPLDPAELVRTVRDVTGARWTGQQLAATCVHPAIDYALREHVRRANEALEVIRQRAGAAATGDPLAALLKLPTRLGDAYLKPAQVDGVPAYDLPHLSFTIAVPEIRELLMGQQLYSDPVYAIRELYQNALDACRYGRARLAYLDYRNECPAAWRGWTWRIRLVHGKTEDGRAFIECTDTGVGMGRNELENCFAVAGRRFRDLPVFLEEQAEWLACKQPIQMFPNGQFGIGVFSYFMLADELEVETCQLDRKGALGHRLLARMSAGAGLFRVRDLGLGKTPGTRVRLYLNEQKNEGFLLAAMRLHLGAAEFETEVEDGGRATWQNGEVLIRDVNEVHGHRAADNIWWAPLGKGEVLADGIRVVLPSRVKWIRALGIVINLAGEHAPKLTVDRNTILNFDEQWAMDQAIKSVKAIANSPHLSMAQAWSIDLLLGADAVAMFKALDWADTAVSLGDMRELAKTLNVARSEYYRVYEIPAAHLAQRLPRIRIARVGCDWRDAGLCFIAADSLDDMQLARALDLLENFKLLDLRAEAGIVGSVGSDSEKLQKVKDLLEVLRAKEWDSGEGAIEQLSHLQARIDVWSSEGLPIPPVLFEIIKNYNPKAEARFHRLALRYYLRIWLQTNAWKWLAGAAAATVLPAGFYFMPRVTMFALSTAVGLVILLFVIFVAAAAGEWWHKKRTQSRLRKQSRSTRSWHRLESKK